MLAHNLSPLALHRQAAASCKILVFGCFFWGDFLAHDITNSVPILQTHDLDLCTWQILSGDYSSSVSLDYFDYKDKSI